MLKYYRSNVEKKLLQWDLKLWDEIVVTCIAISRV